MARHARWLVATAIVVASATLPAATDTSVASRTAYLYQMLDARSVEESGVRRFGVT